jgi:hypothetical protein
MSALLTGTPGIVNVGLSGFVGPMRAAGALVEEVEWQPPGGRPDVAGALAGLVGNPRVVEANRTAHRRLLDADPALVGIERAGDVMPALGERTILHAGPPIGWDDMAGPMQGAIVGAILLEGWADDGEAARQLAASGQVSLLPCHHAGAVGPMAGVTSPSMPVWVVENSRAGNRAYANLNEGLGRVLRFGANDPQVIERLRWMGDRLAPGLRRALAESGPIQLKPLVAQALQMGDECHNRNVAATSLFYRRIARTLVEVSDRDVALDVLGFVDGNDHFFLNLSMAMCKAMLDAAHDVPDSSLVTAMSRNGTNFGIRVSGCGDRWFETPAPVVDGLFFAGYGADDAAPDMGDSSITETAGIGGFAMAAAPAIVGFVGGSPEEAIDHTLRMRHITLGPNPAFSLPQLGSFGCPTGIDAVAVVDTGIAPVINTGIAHKEAGIGQIGAGVTSAPREVFAAAVVALAANLGQVR